MIKGNGTRRSKHDGVQREGHCLLAGGGSREHEEMWSPDTRGRAAGTSTQRKPSRSSSRRPWIPLPVRLCVEAFDRLVKLRHRRLATVYYLLYLLFVG